MDGKSTKSSNELNGLREAYDVIIIGAGVSGLTSAALLSKSDLSVLVLESDARPGGYLAGFRRHDYRFDSAIHWLNQLGPNGLVTRIFDLIGDDHPVAAHQKRIKRYLGDDYDYLLTDNPELLKAQLINDFPEDKAGIERFFKDAKQIGKAFDRLGYLFRTEESMKGLEYAWFMLRKLRFALPFIKHIRFSGPKGVIKGLNRYFTNPKLFEIFCSEMDILSCLVPIGWAYYGDYQLPPVGGSQVFPEWLTHVVQCYNNNVQFHSRVSEIVIEDQKVAGVKFTYRNDEYYARGKYVIAACDIQSLYEKMLPPDVIPKKLKKKLNDAELYSSSVTLSLALDCPVEDLGFGEEMVFISKSGIERIEHANGSAHTNSISLLAPSFRDPTMAPKGKGTLTLYVPAYFDQEDNWHTERGEHGELIRGEAYKACKQKYADVILDRVEKRFKIDLRKHIVYCDIATPITHWRYTGNRDGSMMGARPGKENMQAKIAHYKTPVENLYVGGHWAELGGGVPIAVRAAANATMLVLQKVRPKAANLFAKYMDGSISFDEIQAQSVFLPYDNSWTQNPTPAQKKMDRLKQVES